MLCNFAVYYLIRLIFSAKFVPSILSKHAKLVEKCMRYQCFSEAYWTQPRADFAFKKHEKML